MKSIKSVIVLVALMIGAVSCEEKEEVWSPNDLNVSDITSHTALLGWGGVGNEFEVRAGDSVWIIQKRSLEVKGLTPDTEFRWQIRATREGTHSDWTEHTFKTLPLPAQPTNLNAVASLRAAELSWSGTAKEYEVKIGDSAYVTSNTEHVVSGLTPSTTYTWNVRSIRGVDSSEWVQANFSTLARPAAPTNLAVTASYKSATFTWSGGDPTYELKVGSDTYTVDGVEYTVNNLSIGMQYTWNVRASAGDGIYSDWAQESPASSFSTKDPLSVQISIDNLNVMAADVTVTPGNGVSAYAVIIASVEVYQEFVDIYTDGDEVLFMEIVGELYETDAPTTDTWELNGETAYDYYVAVLLYDNEGNPYPDVIKHTFTSPAYQDGLPEASASITVSEITSSSARVIVTPDANALGFYDGIFSKEDYDGLTTEDIIDELSFYSSPMFEIDNWVWRALSPATDYVVVALPFNANGAAGYGNPVTKSFTTLAGSGAVSSIKSIMFNDRKTHKKALTEETIKMLKLKKKK